MAWKTCDLGNGRERTEYDDGIWLITIRPWGLFVKAMAKCEDGRLRTVKLAHIADSLWTVTARLVYRGKTVCGYISTETEINGGIRFVATGKYKNIFSIEKQRREKLGLAHDTPDEIVSDLEKELGIIPMECK